MFTNIEEEKVTSQQMLGIYRVYVCVVNELLEKMNPVYYHIIKSEVTLKYIFWEMVISDYAVGNIIQLTNQSYYREV